MTFTTLTFTTPTLETERLVLRPWREEDREPFAALNADPFVMRHFPETLTRAESDAMVERIENAMRNQGFGLWALEVKGGAPFIGFCGLIIPSWSAPPVTPCVEIGWRLAAAHHGRGYATESARAVVEHAFAVLNLEELVSMTVPQNTESRRVMEKLGMQRDLNADFDHPKVSEGHVLRRHVLYRLERAAWRASTSA